MPVSASLGRTQNLARARPLTFCPLRSPPTRLQPLPNSEVGTKWVLVPATYSPPQGQVELGFCIREGVVGRERRVSRVRISPIRTGRVEYGTTSNHTLPHPAPAHYIGTPTQNLSSPLS